jgi:hypothetical protein
MVEDDPTPPGGEAFRIPQIVEVEPGGQGGILKYVLDGHRVGHHPAADHSGQGKVSIDEDGESPAIPGPGPLGGICIVGCVGHHTMVVPFRALRVSSGCPTDRVWDGLAIRGPHLPMPTSSIATPG